MARFFRFFHYLTIGTLRQVMVEIGRQRLLGLSAEMAYNNLLALFPMLVAMLAAIGMLDIPQDKVDILAQQLLRMAPEEVLLLIQDFVLTTRLPQGERVVLVSFAIALWVASGALNTAMNAMDQIHQTPPDRRRPFWKAKLIALGLTLATLTLVITASFLVFVSDALLRFVLNAAEIPEAWPLMIWNVIRWASSLVILAIAFCLVYRFGPSQWRSQTPLLPGAIIGALLWEALSRLFRIYVANFSNYNLTYGTLSAGILLLLWLNLSSLTLLIGAQLNVTVGRTMKS